MTKQQMATKTMATTIIITIMELTSKIGVIMAARVMFSLSITISQIIMKTISTITMVVQHTIIMSKR
jgi:hypothetical protein